MFQIDFRSVYMPKTWEKAHALFNDERPLRGPTWQENERPLRDKRAHHLRVVKRADESYDLMLYRHTMIRYHKPTPTHFVVDVFMPWAGNSNWSYIWHAGFGWGSKLPALRHEHPVWLHPYPSSEPEGQSAHLVFKYKGLGRYLDTTKSWQLQAYRYKYTDPERKNKDAFARDRIKSLVMLLAIAQNTYVPEYNTDYRLPIKWFNRQMRASAQISSVGLRSLVAYATSASEELTPDAAEGMTKWFTRTLDVRYTMADAANPDIRLTDKQIEDGLMRLMAPKNPASQQRVKVPTKMWRSGGNRPSRTQFFQTRAEAENAKAALTCSE
jgi:hypothetical protein